MNVGADVIAKSVEWFRDGMFEVAYRINIYRYMDEIEVPRQIAMHPEWDDSQIIQGASRVTNRKFSAPQAVDDWTILSPQFRHLLNNVFISPNEMMSWTSMFTEALPIPRRFDVDAEGRRVLDPSHRQLVLEPGRDRVLRPDENKADVVVGKQWGSANTDSRSFAGGFMSMMGTFAVIATIMEVAATGDIDPQELYSPVSANPSSPLGFGYSSNFLSPAVPGLTGRGGREVRIDLINQADTAFRLLDPRAFFMSRLSVGERFIDNQMKSSTFYGEPLDSPWRKLFQGINDLAPMFVGAGLEEVRHWNDWLEDEIPEGETRLGRIGQAAQGLSGLNLRSETNPQLTNRLTQDLVGKDYLDLEPYQRREIRAYANMETDGEFDRTVETSARRGSEWGRVEVAH